MIPAIRTAVETLEAAVIDTRVADNMALARLDINVRPCTTVYSYLHPMVESLVAERYRDLPHSLFHRVADGGGA